MSFSQKLNDMDKMELEDWLTQKGLQLNERNCQVLTDVSTVARIISKVCPKLVDMGNYMSDSTSLSRLVNWETFNFKVLRQMGLGLTYPELRNVANGKLNALKLLLLNLMHLERDKVKVKPEEIKEKRQMTTGRERQVPYSAYEDLALEFQKKDKYICSISHKLRYLESLLLVKEEIINKLTQQLRTLIVQSQLIDS